MHAQASSAGQGNVLIVCNIYQAFVKQPKPNTSYNYDHSTQPIAISQGSL